MHLWFLLVWLVWKCPQRSLLLTGLLTSVEENTRNRLSDQDHLKKELENVTTITFGSCNRPDKAQLIWHAVLQDSPTAWMWLGDAVYADTRKWLFRFQPSSLDHMARVYEKQKMSKEYQELLRSNISIFGVWDDHDYGINDGDRTFFNKDASQSLFLDFLDTPMDHPIRRQNGVYRFYSLAQGRVLIILLDVRYFKDPYGTSDGDFLGETQWAWLSRVLNDQPGDIVLIGSGVQIISDNRPTEHWGRFPRARKRLVSIVASSGRGGILFLSGDIHFSEVHRLNCSPLGYPVYEFTSSGITHHVPSWLSALVPSLPTRIASYFGLNYGKITIKWEEGEILLEIKDVKGFIRWSHTIPFSELHVGQHTTSACFRERDLERPNLVCDLPEHSPHILLWVMQILERSRFRHFCPPRELLAWLVITIISTALLLFGTIFYFYKKSFSCSRVESSTPIESTRQVTRKMLLQPRTGTD